MNIYQKIAVIVVRGIAVSFLVSTMIEVALLASDTLFVKTGIFQHSEISFKLRVIICAFYFLASMFLFSQTTMIAKTLVRGISDEEDIDEAADDQSDAQD